MQHNTSQTNSKKKSDIKKNVEKKLKYSTKKKVR